LKNHQLLFTRTSKYQLVANRTVGKIGTLVDVGARDKTLQQYLQAEQLQYLSSDILPGHDFCWDLEKPLEIEDNSFDVVVALDVLEHVEKIHDALRELIRVSRNKLFISLPNMTCLSFRIHFFRFGKLSNKYALLPSHQGDRHRWLTGYAQICAFVQQAADHAGCDVQQYNITTGYDRWQRIASHLPLSPALRTYTVVFELSKQPK
jgi:SAM-dependent methyltransferase